jgi:dynein heavy chain, axonemal
VIKTSRFSIFKNSSDILTLFSLCRTALKNLVSDNEFFMFCFAIPQGANNVQFFTEAPSPDKIKKKCVLVLRARSKKEVPGGGELDDSNMSQEIIFMEINKDVLQNLHGICQNVYMPMLGNPLNMIGWSDLVSQDLMDRFHIFLAHTYVTIGQIKGRTMLPLPANDITTSEKTSSKDKAQLLENAINHWTKQIKNVLKLDPENALKKGKHPGPETEIEFW